MRKQDNLHKLGLVLPVIILFGIITINSGSYRSGVGGYNTLYLQPAIPQFQSVNYGSFYFNANPVYVQPTYRYYQPSYLGFNYVPYVPTTPAFSYSRSSQVYFRSYALPAGPVYTTPTRTLFNVNYAYGNVGRLW